MRIGDLVNTFLDGASDLRLGIRTIGIHQSTTPSQYADNEECRPTTYRVIGAIFRHLEPEPGDVFIDYGCGLGRVVCVAAQRPFARVVGVEISPEFARRAEANVVRLKHRQAEKVEVVCANALDFDCAGGNVFFFYNPFGARTLAAVLERVEAAVAAHGKHTRIVYSNCDTRPVMDGARWLTMTRVLRRNRQGGEQVLLYESRRS